MSGLISSHAIETTAQWAADPRNPNYVPNTASTPNPNYVPNTASTPNTALLSGVLPPIQSLPQQNQPYLNYGGINITGMVGPTPSNPSPLSQLAQTTAQSPMIYNPNAMNGLNLLNYGQAGGPMGINWFNGGNQ